MNQNSHAQASRTTSLVSVASENPDNNMTIIDGGLSNEDLADSISLRKSLSIPNKKQTLRQCDQIIFFAIISDSIGQFLVTPFYGTLLWHAPMVLKFSRARFLVNFQ